MGASGTRTGSRRILYCFPRRSTFIQRDIEGLSSRYDVRTHELRAQPAWKLPFRLVHQFAWLLHNRAWSCDCICHFSGYHALLPVMLCRRTFIILAGSDCASIPSIRYGNHARKVLGWATRRAAASATRLLPVHPSLMRRVQTYSSAAPREQGILAFGPWINTPWTAIPYGFDPEQWSPGAATERDPALFISVPGPATPQNRLHRLKGVDMVLAIAERLPEARFTIVGLDDPGAYHIAPGNVTLLGRVSSDGLLELYRKASFHLQLSLSEGMPNALCEAMLCGCVPVVSDVASMPDIVEGCGAVLKRDDPGTGAEVCGTLIALDRATWSARSAASREKVRTAFPMRRRVDELIRIIEDGAPAEKPTISAA